MILGKKANFFDKFDSKFNIEIRLFIMRLRLKNLGTNNKDEWVFQ